MSYVSGKQYKRMTPEQRAAHDLEQDSERAEARLNEPVTRRDIVEAIAQAEYRCGGNVGDHHDAVMTALCALREAFE